MEELVNAYNTSLQQILDKHAPKTNKTVIIRPNTRWYNAEIRQAKVIKRRLERKWKKSQLPADYQKFRDQCQSLNIAITKCKSEFLSQKIVSCEGDARRLFDTCKSLLGSTKKLSIPDCENHQTLANKFNDFFLDKIVKIREGIFSSLSRDSLQTLKEKLFPGTSMNKLQHITPASEEEIKKILKKSSSATCELDPMPTHLLKEHVDTLAPIITKMVNSSLETGACPTAFKLAVISPLLKKENLDKDNFKNYRPVLNLPFISKVLEQVVSSRLKAHLDAHNLWQKNQSAYRAFHCTETALLRVQNDILSSINKKQLVSLVMLDLSAAFDTIDHQKLLDRLSATYRVTGVSLNWFKSYLSDRSQSVRIGHYISDKNYLHFGVPQGSVLRPLLFTLYMSPVCDIATSYGINSMFYADDSQLYVTVNPNGNTNQVMSKLENCIEDIKIWMERNFLKLNDSKTEFIVFGSKLNLGNVSVSPITVGDCKIPIASTVKNLGVVMDSLLNMDNFVKAKARSININLRKCSRIRKYLTHDACRSLVQATVQSRLDYCSSLLYGIKNQNISHLQRIQNSAARLIYRLPSYEHSSGLQHKLHWLPVKQRIEFRILT